MSQKLNVKVSTKMHRFKLALFLSVTAFAPHLAPASAQGLPPCRPGFEAPKLSPLNYPATVLAVDEQNGTYQVKQQDGQVVWVGADSLRYSCTGVQAKPVDQSYFMGKWTTFIPPVARYEVLSGKTYLTVGTGAGAFPIEIKSDGTYTWMQSNRPGAEITGRWRTLASGEYKYGTKPNGAPVILLMKGESGDDWYVSRKGTSFQNVEQIHIENMRIGLTQSGTRMR